MAGPNLSTHRTITDTADAHVSDHNTAHGIVNLFDKDASPTDGQLLTFNQGAQLWQPATNVSTFVMPPSLGLPAHWRYTGSGYPTLPITQPAGISVIYAAGPTFPTTIPSWVGMAAGKIPLRYSKAALA
jgi:hypothetical protein